VLCHKLSNFCRSLLQFASKDFFFLTNPLPVDHPKFQNYKNKPQTTSCCQQGENKFTLFCCYWIKTKHFSKLNSIFFDKELFANFKLSFLPSFLKIVCHLLSDFWESAAANHFKIDLLAFKIHHKGNYFLLTHNVKKAVMLHIVQYVLNVFRFVKKNN
jgi:hypothetical protein